MKKTSKSLLLRRVKVYFLDDNLWIDNGTGYCFGELDREEMPYLIVRNELDQKHVLLKAKIEGSITFQRQQETLIVWTDLEGKTMALSFQEREGCLSLCDFIIKVQRGSFAPEISLVTIISTDLDGDIRELITGPVNYPPVNPNSDDLMNISNCFNENLSSVYQKQSIADFLKKSNYLQKLIDLFNIAEENKKIRDLHLLCNIVKTLLLYNESEIIELILEDENMMGIVGILEYDPSYPEYKFNHRFFLKDDAKFKEIIPLHDNAIKALIKRTFRLQSLKDVVLSRLLDDPTFNLVSTLIHLNQVEIIKFLETGKFIDALFSLYKDVDDGKGVQHGTQNPELLEKRRDGIKLLYQFILIAKNLQSPQKTSFYKSLIKKGLFKTINFVLNDDSAEIRVVATEMIVAIIEHDVLLISGDFQSENDESMNNEPEKRLTLENEHDPKHDPDHEPDREPEQKDEPHHEAELQHESENVAENGSGHSEHENEGESVNDSITRTPNGKLHTNGADSFNDDFFDGLEYEKEEEMKKTTLSDDMTLLLVLTSFLLEDSNYGLKIQAFEALKSLLDPASNFYSNNFANDDSALDHLNTTNYFNAFYEQVAPKLFGPLTEISNYDDGSDDDDYNKEINTSNDELYSYLCELITFCSKDKSVSRSFFLENHVLVGVAHLIKPGHKLQLRLAAIRCFKSIILLNDDYYTRYIISYNLFEQVFKLLDENENSSNLTSSTILDLIEIVLIGIEKYENKKNFKLLATYMVTNFKSSLSSINCISSGDDLIRIVELNVRAKSIKSSGSIDSTDGNGINGNTASTDDNNSNNNNNNNNNNNDDKDRNDDDNDKDDDDDNEEFTREEISTEPLSEEDSILQEEILNNSNKNGPKINHGEDGTEDGKLKRKLSFKDKVSTAGKKLASKFHTK